MSEAVNHPAHYGGESNPYEVIKVLRAWMTPVEMAGFLKGNVIKYLARAAGKGRNQDIQKAAWYQNYLDKFARETGADVLFPPSLYWGNDGVPYEDDGEIVAIADMLTVVAVHCNVEPHTRWAVRFPVGEDETDVQWFDHPAGAESFRRSFFEEAKRGTAD